ncbi:mechanosensitive ion channel [Candidatus Latescibacterota bacterium]
MEALWQQFLEVGRDYLFGLIAPLAILVLGWLLALIVSSGIRRLLRRADLDRRLGHWMSGDEGGDTGVDMSKWVGRVAYYLIMLFVLVAFFQSVGLTMVTGPLTEMLTDVFAYAPRLVSAGVLLLVAWVLASVLRFIIAKGLARARVDERLGESAELQSDDGISVSASIASAVYWLVFLLFLPAILSALSLEGLLQPVREMLGEVVGFLPNLVAAGGIILIGWFAARIVQRIASNLLAATNLDKAGAALGTVLGEGTLSGLVGRVAYVLVLIPAAIMALDTLDLKAVSNPASAMLSSVLEFLPALFSAGLVLLIAYLVGRLVAGLVSELLSRTGFDRILATLGISQDAGDGQEGPSELAGKLVLISIMLFAAIEAADLVGFATLSGLLAQVTVFGSKILLALVIFALGLYMANLVAAAIKSRSAEQGVLLATLARGAILVLFTAMALRHVGVANEIITSAFILLLGAIAVAVALAFGLGGREAAAKQVEKWFKAVRADLHD